jgi:hypothetical protein
LKIGHFSHRSSKSSDFLNDNTQQRNYVQLTKSLSSLSYKVLINDRILNSFELSLFLNGFDHFSLIEKLVIIATSFRTGGRQTSVN